MKIFRLQRWLSTSTHADIQRTQNVAHDRETERHKTRTRRWQHETWGNTTTQRLMFLKQPSQRLPRLPEYLPGTGVRVRRTYRHPSCDRSSFYGCSLLLSLAQRDIPFNAPLTASTRVLLLPGTVLGPPTSKPISKNQISKEVELNRPQVVFRPSPAHLSCDQINIPRSIIQNYKN